MTIISTTVGRHPSEEMGVAIMVNERVRNAVLGCNLINNRMGKTRDFFKKIRDTKGTFHAKMDSIKDRNDMDLTEEEDIKKRWQEYTELYKKDLQHR